MVDEKKKSTASLEKKAASAFSKAVARQQRPKLDVAFKRAATKDGAKLAQKTLSVFNKATQRLLREEAKHKTRDRWQKLSLTHYLRSAEHMAALKEFEESKKGLLAVNPAVGQKLIDRAEGAILEAIAAVPAQRFSKMFEPRMH